jgi:hypothetical protein
MATSSASLQGAGTGEPPEALRAEETIHRFRSPFGEGHGGVLAGRSGSGMERANAAGSSQLGQEPRRPGISRAEPFSTVADLGGGSR